VKYNANRASKVHYLPPSLRFFRPDSDIDLLVEFEPDHTPSLLQMARLERELSAFFGGRKIDLRTKEDLSRYFRDAVVASAKVIYHAR
jgi:predicted nucleotidyltransferase